MAKSKLTPELQAEVIQLLEEGFSDKMMCEAVGIVQSTFYHWLQQGEEATRGKFQVFLESVKRARGNVYRISLEKIRREADNTWQCAAWYLERRHRSEFGKHEHQVHEVVHAPVVEGEYEDPWLEEDEDDGEE